MRDGHFKASQGKLELLERLCRALQKERNELNNRLSLLQKEEGHGIPTPSENQPLESSGRGEEGDEEDDDDKDLFPDSSGMGDVHQAPRPPEMHAPANEDAGTVTVAENSKQN